MAANFMPPPATVHPAVQPLAFLLGTWRGQGEGRFPTISPFTYSEELNFSHSPNKPVIAYSSKTWKLNTNQPMHAESGYWRPQIDGTIEVVIAQSTGLAEVQKGTFDAKQRIVKLKSALVGNASKHYLLALSVISSRRVYIWRDDCIEGLVYLCFCTFFAVALVAYFHVKQITRVFKMGNGELSYEVEMATNLSDLQPHLKASLKKI